MARNGYKLHERAVSIALDCYSQAKHFRMTHDQLLDNLNERLYKTPLWSGTRHQRLTEAERAYVRGRQDGASSEIYNNHVKWGLVSTVLGRAVERWEDLPEFDKELCRQGGAIIGHHYWVDANGAIIQDKTFT